MKPVNDIPNVIKNSKLLYSADYLEKSIATLAKAISLNYNDKEPIFLCVLLSSIQFTAKLISYIDFAMQLDYIDTTRYGNKEVGGEISFNALPRSQLKNRTVIILDDILDSGITMNAIVEYVQNQQALEVVTAVMIDKPNNRDQQGLQKADYSAITLNENKWIYGYGMDYHSYLRNRNGIYYIDKD